MKDSLFCVHLCVRGFQCSNWRSSPRVHHASNWNEHRCAREGVSSSKSSAMGTWDLLGGPFVCVCVCEGYRWRDQDPWAATGYTVSESSCKKDPCCTCVYMCFPQTDLYPHQPRGGTGQGICLFSTHIFPSTLPQMICSYTGHIALTLHPH